MLLFRWLSTFLSFPIAGAVAILIFGGADDPGIAAVGGLLVGAVVGLTQWLAVRGRGIGPVWVLATSVGMAIGGAAAVAATDASTTIAALVTTGIVSGAVVGALQGRLLGRGWSMTALWSAVVSLAWGAGWLVTGNVIVDAEKGFYAFGASGALVATITTGLVLRVVLTDTTSDVRPAVAPSPVGALR